MNYFLFVLFRFSDYFILFRCDRCAGKWNGRIVCTTAAATAAATAVFAFAVLVLHPHIFDFHFWPRQQFYTLFWTSFFGFGWFERHRRHRRQRRRRIWMEVKGENKNEYGWLQVATCNVEWYFHAVDCGHHRHIDNCFKTHKTTLTNKKLFSDEMSFCVRQTNSVDNNRIEVSHFLLSFLNRRTRGSCAGSAEPHSGSRLLRVFVLCIDALDAEMGSPRVTICEWVWAVFHSLRLLLLLRFGRVQRTGLLSDVLQQSFRFLLRCKRGCYPNYSGIL